VFALAGVLAGCADPSAQQRADAAQTALNSGDFGAARTDAEAGLGSEEAKADVALAWRLEKLRLDALAGGRNSVELLASLERLQAAHADRIDAALYVSLTDKLTQVGDFIGAIDVVHAGRAKFPDRAAYFDGELDILIEAAKQAAEGGNNAALDHLAGLGYLSKPKR